MPNEAKTENLVRERLRKHGYYKEADIVVEEKQSDLDRIKKLLRYASKRGAGKGYPDFIITSKTRSGFLIVIECKADLQKHVSPTLDKYAECAVDGALLYASCLSKAYDVLAVGVSGETPKELRISHYLYLMGAKKPIEVAWTSILSFEDYYENFSKSDVKFRQDYDVLLGYSRELNEQLQAKKIKEAHRGLLICGILVALENAAFKNSYKSHKNAKTLAKSLVDSVINEFEGEDNLPKERIENLKQAFSFIRTNTTLISDQAFFVSLIEEIDRNVNYFVRTHKYHDAIGQFYVQFLRYANNDKGLGIVLTPPHITELFAELAEVNKNSIVLDNCCGTAGFLIAAMKKMLIGEGISKKKRDAIKNKQLIGIEYQDDIYALAVSNMVIHDDGRTTIIPGDCFALSGTSGKKYKPTVGLLNPPYKTPGSTIEELDFVLNNLDALQPGGKCVAILPLDCAIGDNSDILERKRKILECHTLEAVMTMPSDLFRDSKVNVITCTMVITAHQPHPKGKKTWFGYWRDDGFVKTKDRGRFDANGRWKDIREKWLSTFRGREVIPRFSVMKEVGYKDEWCAEEYMEPDWSLLNKEELAKTFREFAIHKLLTEVENA